MPDADKFKEVENKFADHFSANPGGEKSSE